MSSTEYLHGVPLADLVPLERNPRRHPESQLEAIVDSLRQFGQYRPLVVDETNTVLAGNGLLLGMQRAGFEAAHVYRVSGLNEAQKKKLILADNRIGDLSNDDFDVVEQMIRDLGAMGDLEVPGFDPDVLAQLVASADDILASASEYGTLDDETRERLNAKRGEIDEAQSNVSVGTPPGPMQPGAGAGAGSNGAGNHGGSACPTCGRPW